MVAQTTRDFEYIVIDGGSTDGSVEVIKEYAEYIDYWVSEPDKGIYNAMNKGVRVAHGEYCNFLNSGDSYYSENVVSDFIALKNKTDILVGITAYLKAWPTECLKNKTDILGKSKIGRSVNNDINFLDLFRGGINHQAAFIRTDICRQIPYDEDYRICSDWKFFIDALIFENCSFSTFDNIVVNYDMEGISNKNMALHLYEKNKIMDSYNIPPRILCVFEQLDRDTFKVAAKLHIYHKFRIYLCKFNMKLISIYKIISHIKP